MDESVLRHQSLKKFKMVQKTPMTITFIISLWLIQANLVAQQSVLNQKTAVLTALTMDIPVQDSLNCNHISVVSWVNILRNIVQYDPTFLDSLGYYVHFPKFDSTLLQLNNQTISIGGYISEVIHANDASFRLLFASKKDFDTFSQKAALPSLEGVMEIAFNDNNEAQQLKGGDYLQLKGRFELNTADIYHLNYILWNATVCEEE